MKKNRILMDAAGPDGGEGGGVATLLTAQAVPTPPAPPAPNDPPAPPAPPAPADMPEWLKGMGQGLEDNDKLKRYKSPKELAAAYLSASKFISSDKINVPGKHTTDDEWTGIFRKLGVPEKVEEYEITLDEKLGFDSDFQSEYKKMAHSLGVLPKQAQKLIEWAGQYSQTNVQKQSEAYTAKLNTGVEELKKEWGAAYNQKLARGIAAYKAVATPELNALMESTKLGNHAGMLRMFDAMAEKMNMEGTFRGPDNAAGTQLTPEQAKAEISKIMGDKTHAYFDKTHPAHAAAVDEVRRLFEAQMPNAKEIKFRGAQ